LADRCFVKRGGENSRAFILVGQLDDAEQPVAESPIPALHQLGQGAGVAFVKHPSREPPNHRADRDANTGGEQAKPQPARAVPQAVGEKQDEIRAEQPGRSEAHCHRRLDTPQPTLHQGELLMQLIREVFAGKLFLAAHVDKQIKVCGSLVIHRPNAMRNLPLGVIRG
jgi:hypothetical protein